MKRFFDLTVGAFAFVCLLVPIILVAIAVRLTSTGPALYWSDRVGRNNAIFKMPKFRSMQIATPAVATHLLSNPDAYLTPIGSFLRKSSLDELPQLFNVLQGHMALVGPRPHAVAHNNYYSGKILAYMARHRIKPGITGLAQINGCRGETDTIDKMQKRVEIDLKYINNWSLWLDFVILVRTLNAFTGKQAY